MKTISISLTPFQIIWLIEAFKAHPCSIQYDADHAELVALLEEALNQ